MEKKQRYYNEEFKIQIVKLVQSGREVKELATEYGISVTAIRTWVKQYAKTGTFSIAENLTESEKELKTLRKENKQLRMENDILKQAALILARKEV